MAYDYRVIKNSFFLDGKEYKKGDLVTGPAAAKIEADATHLQHFVVRIATVKAAPVAPAPAPVPPPSPAPAPAPAAPAPGTAK